MQQHDTEFSYFSMALSNRRIHAVCGAEQTVTVDARRLHILLVFAVVMVLVNLISGRRAL